MLGFLLWTVITTPSYFSCLAFRETRTPYLNHLQILTNNLLLLKINCYWNFLLWLSSSFSSQRAGSNSLDKIVKRSLFLNPSILATESDNSCPLSSHQCLWICFHYFCSTISLSSFQRSNYPMFQPLSSSTNNVLLCIQCVDSLHSRLSEKPSAATSLPPSPSLRSFLWTAQVHISDHWDFWKGLYTWICDVRVLKVNCWSTATREILNKIVTLPQQCNCSLRWLSGLSPCHCQLLSSPHHPLQLR